VTQTPRPFPAQLTYDSTAERYAALSAKHWRWAAAQTVESLQLSPTSNLLDVGSGPGVVALLAAGQFDPTALGYSLGVDLSPEMVAIARFRAREAGLRRVHFFVADMADLPEMFTPRCFDAVTSVFSVFFAPQIQPTLTALWDLVAPRGRLAVTTLGHRFFAPVFHEVYLPAVSRELGYVPDVPWDRTADPDALAQLFLATGAPIPTVRTETREIALSDPDDFWDFVLGTGMVGLMDGLPPDAVDRIHAATTDAVASRCIHTVDLEAVLALATKR
jgi:ubiquinone/menaquinone biosynthesis C-methylase UbiE